MLHLEVTLRFKQHFFLCRWFSGIHALLLHSPSSWVWTWMLIFSSSSFLPLISYSPHRLSNSILLKSIWYSACAMSSIPQCIERSLMATARDRFSSRILAAWNKRTRWFDNQCRIQNFPDGGGGRQLPGWGRQPTCCTREDPTKAWL